MCVVFWEKMVKFMLLLLKVVLSGYGCFVVIEILLFIGLLEVFGRGWYSVL